MVGDWDAFHRTSGRLLVDSLLLGDLEDIP